MRPKIIDVDCLLPIFHQGEDFKHLQRILDWTDEEDGCSAGGCSHCHGCGPVIDEDEDDDM